LDFHDPTHDDQIAVGERVLAPLLILLGASLGAMNDQARAQEAARRPESVPANAELEAVTIKGRRRLQMVDERLSAFVSSLAIRSRTESLARWQVAICPLVVGASSELAQFILDRTRQVAEAAGVPVAARGCPANLVIALTPDPRQFLIDWWAEEHRLFNWERGAGSIDRFLRSDEPIRAWYNACSVAPAWTKTISPRRVPPCNTGELGSRLSWTSVRAIYSVIVVVDLDRIQDLSIGQLSDYVAVVSLAQVRRDAEFGNLPTILRLFSAEGPARPRGMSSWDKSFLESLYRIDLGNVTQLSQIKTGMTLKLGGDGPDTAAAVARLLTEVNLVGPGAGRVLAYAETGAYYEGPPELRSALVNFEAEIEFVGDSHFHGQRKAGDRAKVYGEVEYINEGSGWRLLRMPIYPF
jgi:hypothetical protein